MTVRLLPGDAHDRALEAHVRPPEWINPEPSGRYNLVVIGAGTAGLVTAAGAAGLGAKVALVEKDLMGGDCLNVGCVPSKALIRSARAAADARETGFGVRASDVRADFAAVMERLRRLRAGISGHDSARRFRELGVDVFLGEGRFLDGGTVEVGGKKLRFAKAVIAAGARAADPGVPGLAEAGFLTNETVFSLTELPRRLAVIGGGPIGCELAQAFRRLGAEVTLLHKNARLLDREDADAAEVVRRALVRDGVRLVLNAALRSARKSPQGIALLSSGGPAGEGPLEADQVLAGAGRAPNVEGLGLEAAGVEYDRRAGVKVDDFLRTSNPRIYACGDVCLEKKFTHAADFTARLVIQNALFFGRKRLSSLVVPWCTYTDPEVAHVGMYEGDARAAGLAAETFVRELKDVDRAVVDGETEGFVKVLAQKGGGRVLGATVVARHAGEMIGELTLAVKHGLKLGALADVIHPYPTQAEAVRQTGDLYNRARLTPAVKALLAGLLRWRR